MNQDVEREPSERVGKRVSVFWPEEDEWFDGIVQEHDEFKGFYVVYDDGDERWEPMDQPMNVEGETEAERARKDDGLPLSGRGGESDESNGGGPEMMEPPASPGSAYSDADYANDYQENEDAEGPPAEVLQRDNEQMDTKKEISEDEDEGPANDPGSQSCRGQQSSDEDDSQEKNDEDQRYDGGTDEEDDKRNDEEPPSSRSELPQADTENDSETSDEEQSVIASELPHTYGKATDVPAMPKPSALGATIPAKGVLSGRVLRASRLRGSGAHEPSAFVKASFVEAGNTANVGIMLRCKQTLSTTAVISNSADPAWSGDLSSDEEEGLPGNRARGTTSKSNGSFRLQLVAPTILPASTPAWAQLQGDLLFTAYSASSSGGSARRGGHEHIGQAVVPLQHLVQELLASSPTTTRYLELQPRTSKLSNKTGRAPESSFFDHDEVEPPELVVCFRFRPIFEQAAKPKGERAPSCTSTTYQLSSRAAAAKATSRVNMRRHQELGAPAAHRKTPAHTSSSQINRRRFEKQVESENRAFAKRLEWQEARRTRRSTEAKAQEKRKVTPPQHGARKFDHKPSSRINRSKFVQQVSQENKSMGKRLQRILGVDSGTQKPGNFCCWAAAESKDSSNADYMARDKVYVLDQRLQRQTELDFAKEKAQSKYQQQNQAVEEVMGLQEDVAALKSQVETLTKSATRLEILNKKDQHVRDCLLRAAARSSDKPSPRESSRRPLPSTTKPSAKPRSDNNGAVADGDSPRAGKGRKEQEYELLRQHQEHLQAEIHRQSQELQSLSKQEDELDRELHEKQAQFELAQATQAFHRWMEKKNAAQAQKAAQEMERRRKAMELSLEEEEHWTLYQAHQELKQLQITCQVLRDRRSGKPHTTAKNSRASACEYLSQKIAKHKAKLALLKDDVEQKQHEYEALLVHGGHERLRQRVQELQRLVFLCQMQATHVRHAERVAQRKGEQLELAFQRRLFQEQTETEIALKKRPVVRAKQQ